MFLTRVFIKAQLPLDGHKAGNKRPITMMKTFSALGLKLQALEKEKEKEKKDKKKKDSFIRETVQRRRNPNLLVKARRRKEEKEVSY